MRHGERTFSVSTETIERAGGHSTLALYSRSQLGKGDLGVNRARIERWLAELGREVPVAR